MINGMVEVHKNNVLHRDLKPENIFINKNGNTTTAKIGDFGLARQLNSQNNQNDLNESSTDI
jgi:serine/threonine protein kinase